MILALVVIFNAISNPFLFYINYCYIPRETAKVGHVKEVRYIIYSACKVDIFLDSYN